MSDFGENPISQPFESVAVQPPTRNGNMSAEDLQILDRYRALHKEAEAQRSKVRDAKARIREQLQKISGLEGSARDARNRFHENLTQQVARGAATAASPGAKEEVARLEGDLAEARGILRGLEAELPRLEASVPNETELERAKREAWNAVVRDLQSKVPAEVRDFAAKIYAGMLNHYPNAVFSAALATLCPAPPTRQMCTDVSAKLAREYNLPID